MGAAMRYQPQGLARLYASNPIAAKATAVFPFNGSFRSAASRSGNPVVTAGPAFVLGPNGYYALGNGVGKVVTDLTASLLGMAGAAPRTIIAEFYMGDTSAPKCLLSFGDTSTGARTQFTVLINNGYRGISIQTYGTDLNFAPHTVGGTGFRVFLAITYDGNVTLSVRAWSTLDSTGQVIPYTTSFTLPAPLATGTTFPLNLMGGGTYGFQSMVTPFYHLSMYGGRVLSDAEIFSIYQNKWQLFDAGSSSSAYQAAIVSTSAPASNGTTPTTIGAGTGASSSSGQSGAVSNPTNVAGMAGGGVDAGQGAAISNPTNIGTGSGASVDAGLAVSASNPTNIASTTGSETGAGQGVTVSSGTSVTGGAGSETGSGQSAAISNPTTVSAGKGTSSSSGQGATVSSGAAITAGGGTSTSAGQGATVSTPDNVTAGTGTSTGAGQGATVSSGAGVAAGTGASSGTGQVAAISNPVNVTAGMGASSSSGQRAALSNPTNIVVDVAGNTSAGKAAQVVIPTNVVAGGGAMSSAGLSAAVSTEAAADTSTQLLPNPKRTYLAQPRVREYIAQRRVREI